MHRSRIGVVLIDHQESNAEAAVAFWAGVQGVEPVADEDDYWQVGSIGAVTLDVQRTGEGTPPRIHLDIETDDVAAEVARVVGLGATVLEERDGYTVLLDPGGVLFCVVPVQNADAFERHATTRA